MHDIKWDVTVTRVRGIGYNGPTLFGGSGRGKPDGIVIIAFDFTHLSTILCNGIAAPLTHGFVYINDTMTAKETSAPSHRATILNRNLLFLGCGVHACTCAKFHVYATQNFASVVP